MNAGAVDDDDSNERLKSRSRCKVAGSSPPHRICGARLLLCYANMCISRTTLRTHVRVRV